MANLATDTDAERAAAVRRRYLVRFEEDTVATITAVRGLPVKEEREAAQGGALPLLGSPSGNGH
jgi:hypothetical protein